MIVILVSCSKNDDINNNSLSTYILNKTIEIGAVIACAASDEVTNDVLVFYYPETGASNIRLYETTDTEADKNEFSNYLKIETEPFPFFNGYLGKFVRDVSTEKWAIVTFELNGEIKISNPILTKHISKPSVWTEDVSINQLQTGMPNFNWTDNAFGDNAIYFQVVSDIQNNLLSGTYTFENQFQYYNTSNVVLNITTQTPTELTIGTSYNFTLMDISEDNWVNSIIQKTFGAQ
ncbi:hypothetical protein JYT76_00010 [Olleya sp. AH-315-F22]|nr:hypothetical protein [Olleya sp. AH-315-F22]